MELSRGTLSRHVFSQGRGIVSRHALGRLTISRHALGQGTLSKHVLTLERGTVSKHARGCVTVSRHALGQVSWAYSFTQRSGPCGGLTYPLSGDPA